jgi:hypothetical protein
MQIEAGVSDKTLEEAEAAPACDVAGVRDQRVIDEMSPNLAQRKIAPRSIAC